MNDTPFVPLLTTTDWNEEWKTLQRERKRFDSPAQWDERAKTFPVKHGSQEGYVARFLELADIGPDDVVLDMGCGTGALCTPLAARGNRVIACDFSAGMLDKMVQDHRQLGIENVESNLLSWDDDWKSFGLGEDSVDVAIASRSIATTDLAASLAKLTSVARRRACITIPAGPSPRIDERLLRAAGVDSRVGRDFLYAFNILAAQGLYPEVAFIPSERKTVFASPDEAREKLSEIVSDVIEVLLSPEEVRQAMAKLRLWLEDNVVECADGYHLKGNATVVWAFIAWSTR